MILGIIIMYTVAILFLVLAIKSGEDGLQDTDNVSKIIEDKY